MENIIHRTAREQQTNQERYDSALYQRCFDDNKWKIEMFSIYDLIKTSDLSHTDQQHIIKLQEKIISVCNNSTN